MPDLCSRTASKNNLQPGRIRRYFRLCLPRGAAVLGLLFLPARFFARARRRISSGEYMLFRQFFDPQLHRASSSSPS